MTEKKHDERVDQLEERIAALEVKVGRTFEPAVTVAPAGPPAPHELYSKD